MGYQNRDYRQDAATHRVIRRDAVMPGTNADLVLEPGELADIADFGRLQGILTTARQNAADRFGADGERALLGVLWSLHEEGGVLLIRWVTLAGFRAFSGFVEDAWRADGEWAFIHFVSTDREPVCWCDGLDPFGATYAHSDAVSH